MALKTVLVLWRISPFLCSLWLWSLRLEVCMNSHCVCSGCPEIHRALDLLQMFKRFLPPARVRISHQSEAELSCSLRSPAGPALRSSIDRRASRESRVHQALQTHLCFLSSAPSFNRRLQKAAGVQVEFSRREGSGAGPQHRDRWLEVSGVLEREKKNQTRLWLLPHYCWKRT